MKRLLIILFSLLTFSCATSKDEVPKIDFEKFEFFYIKNGDKFNFYFVFNPIYKKLSDTINIDKIILTFNSKSLKDKITLNLENVFATTFQNSESTYQQTYIFYGHLTSMDLNGTEPEDIMVEAKASYKKITFKRKETFPSLQLQPNYAKLEFLKLYPKFNLISDELIELDLFAIRVVPHSGEYLPSSEIIRAELYNFKSGKRISSSEGKNFLQVITDVEPKVVGDFKIFSTQINLSKQQIMERNLIRYIIPAIPNNYSVELNFWKDK